MSVRLAAVPGPDEVRRFPVVVDVPTAGRCYGLGRDLSYDLARAGQFPVPVLRLGTTLRVTRASLMAALGIPDQPPVESRPGPDRPGTAINTSGEASTCRERNSLRPAG